MDTKDIFNDLRFSFGSSNDDTGSIGKLSRQDAIGTPFCVTVDFESLDDKLLSPARPRQPQEQVPMRNWRSLEAGRHGTQLFLYSVSVIFL